MGVWRAGVAERLASDETPVSMARLLNELNALMPADGILVADGGFAAHWGGLLYDTRRPGRGFVPDRGFASIGYGLPGAIGATLAAPGRAVASLTGDGGFNMMIGELETARRLGAGVVVLVWVDNAYGMIEWSMQSKLGRASGVEFGNPDFVKYAEAYGLPGFYVDRLEDLGPTLEKAFGMEGMPSIVAVPIDYRENANLAQQLGQLTTVM